MWRSCLAAALLCLGFPDQGRAEDREVDLELVVAVDISRSMDAEEAVLQRQGVVGAFRHPEVIDAIRRGRLGRIAVTFAEWGGAGFQRTRVGWAEIADRESAFAFAAAIERSDAVRVERTSISAAILFAGGRFAANGFHGERRVIDVSGDGPNNDGPNVALVRDAAVADGIVINGLPIINGRPNGFGFPSLPDLDLYYEDCVIGGPGAFMVVAEGFEDFARAMLRKLITEIAAGPVPGPLPGHAVAWSRPTCNAGENQLRDWLRYEN